MNREKHLYEFGPFHIDDVERLLFRGEAMIPLTPKATDTLLALVSNPGRVLEKEELIKIVWPDTFVEEGGLARNISMLRKVFGEGTEDVQFIETIPKRGYRFAAHVSQVRAEVPPEPATELETPPQPPPAAPDPPRRSGRLAWVLTSLLVLAAVAAAYFYWSIRPAPGNLQVKSLAVLPLTNPSNAPSQEYFTEGMTEELINSLARIEALRVISRTSAMTYKGAKKSLRQIGHELDVDAIVDGSVMESGGRVRITIQLFEVKTERQLWAQSYERDLRDVLALQSEVASSIAREIQVKLTAQDKERLASSRPVNVEAYLAYSSGRYHWNQRTQEGFQRGIENFQRAIAKDASYAPAYAGLADAYALLGSIGFDMMPPKEVMPKAKAAAVEAVRLDDSLAEAHASLGYAKLTYDWDLAGADHEFKRALSLNPGYATAHHWYAHYLLAVGQPTLALAEMKRAQVLDPLSVVINLGVGWCLYQARRSNEAIEQYTATLDMNPNLGLAHATLGMAYQQSRMYPEAMREFKRAAELPGGSPALAMAGLGSAYGQSGKRSEALQVLADLEKAGKKQYVPAVYVAAIYASMGDRDNAILWTRRGFEERSEEMVYLKTEPWADSLRPDSRFQELLQLVAHTRP